MTSTETLPRFPQPEEQWREFVTASVRASLARATTALGSLRAGAADCAWEAWNDADIELSNAHQLVESIAEVHPDADVRHSCTELVLEIAAFRTARDGDPELYAALTGAPAPEGAGYLRDLVLRDFRLQGAHLDAPDRERLAQIDQELASAETAFSENIREDVGRIRVAPGALAGLPDDYVAEHPRGEDGLVEITTDYPDMAPFLAMAHDRAAREALVRVDYDRAYPANDEVLGRILRLRDEKARLLGFSGWPDYATARMMMRDGAGIEAFLEQVDAAARPAGTADAAMLLERLRDDHPEAAGITVADSRYYIERIKAERFGVDPHEVRRFLDFGRVRDGILELAGELFDLRFDTVADAPRWHADVEAYDVVSGDQRIGRILLDMHPRAGKYGHMACFPIVTGIAGRQLPVSALVCNFPRGSMTFDDLQTFLHEFGHLLHAILSGAGRWMRLAGLSERGEWDFVEAPSQLLEEWAWDHTVLARFAVDGDGTAIPASLVESLRSSRHLAHGLLTCRQLVYAQLSYRLHRDVPQDRAAFATAIEERYDVRELLTGTHQYASFGHLTTYSACYYTYQWSLAIARDLFTGFDQDDLLNKDNARRYRDAVLVPGGERPASALVEEFLGRPFSAEAYTTWLAQLDTTGAATESRGAPTA
ncbi:M3 family metallopeptidase [Demequina sp. NBRC 110053]|uniref:M3 family metallopeptidase n=1 Tax=Demequina sp. NBRC 110053 TaxID=1570342 RepID=UPI0009FE0201|nr:M3 family metallopeptidase [Demequina sp. NBRC 110053]